MPVSLPLAAATRRFFEQGGVAPLFQFLAGHLVAAWGHQLHSMVAAGKLDAALAYEVALIRARLDLVGHRMLAFLHLDSDSGHPHLHVIFARVRDQDLSLWSVSGRERAPALWLHARSRTVQTLGSDALPGDVDALAGMSSSARGGERLLANDALTVERSDLHGSAVKIPVQGPQAASRMAAVGTCAQPQMAGGIWRFGLGCDPEQMRAWRASLATLKTSGDRQRIAEIIKQRPHQRGYWNPTQAMRQAAAFRKTSGYVDYLARRR